MPLIRLASLILASILISSPGVAQSRIAPALPGWTHPTTQSGPAAAYGVPLPARVGASYPVITDATPSPGKEVVLVSVNGEVTLLSSNGTQLWRTQIPGAVCPAGGEKVYSSPAVGALFGDGIPYIVVGYGGVNEACDGGVIALRASDGAITWDFSLRSFHASRGTTPRFVTVYSTPALADTDRDGKLEVGFGSLDHFVYLLNADGSLRWSYDAADTVFSSPTFANVDRDRSLEMIIGTDITGNRAIKPITRNGGILYALKTRRTRIKHYPFRSRRIIVWQRAFEQVLQSSPVVADVDARNKGAEIVVASGCYFPEGTEDKAGKWVKVVRMRDGRVIRTLTTPACSSSSVAIGDVNEDGRNDIVAIANGARTLGGPGEAQLLAWSGNRGELLWATVPRDRERSDPQNGTFTSPLIADLDGNGSLEVVVTTLSSIGIFNGRDGAPLTCQTDDCDGLYALFSPQGLSRVAAIGDVNGDGALDIVSGGRLAEGDGGAFAWSGFRSFLRSPAGRFAPYSAPWPFFRGSQSRQGT